MKNILISAALLASLAFGTASAQTDELYTSNDDFSVYDDVGSFDVAYGGASDGVESADESDNLNLEVIDNGTFGSSDDVVEDPGNSVNMDDILDGTVEVTPMDGNEIDSVPTDENTGYFESTENNLETPASDLPENEGTVYEGIDGDGKLDPFGQSKDSSGIQTSCGNGTCTVKVDGMLRGEFPGQSINVSTSSVNGAKVTSIYVDGVLVDQF